MWEQIKSLWASSRVFQVTVVAAAIAGAVIAMRNTPDPATNPFSAASVSDPIDEITKRVPFPIPGGGAASKSGGAIEATAEAVQQTARTVTKGGKVVETGVDIATHGVEAVGQLVDGVLKNPKPNDSSSDVAPLGKP